MESCCVRRMMLPWKANPQNGWIPRQQPGVGRKGSWATSARHAQTQQTWQNNSAHGGGREKDVWGGERGRNQRARESRIAAETRRNRSSTWQPYGPRMGAPKGGCDDRRREAGGGRSDKVGGHSIREHKGTRRDMGLGCVGGGGGGGVAHGQQAKTGRARAHTCLATIKAQGLSPNRQCSTP